MAIAWFKEDIRNALLAAQKATRSAPSGGVGGDQYAQGYQDGYRSALLTLGIAFGVLDEMRQLPAGSR